MKKNTQLSFTNGLIIFPLIAIALMAISASDRVEYYGNTVHVHDFVKLKMSREEFLDQLTKNNIDYKQSSEFLFFRNDTFDRYVLNNIPLSSGTVHSAILGVHRKGNKLEVYIEHIEVSEIAKANPTENKKEHKQWRKKYRDEALSFFNGLDH